MTVEIRVLVTRARGCLCENWNCPNEYAREKLGYVPKKTGALQCVNTLLKSRPMFTPGRCYIPRPNPPQ